MSAMSRLPTSLARSVLAARIALVVGVCVLIGVLPSLFTREPTEIVLYTAPKSPSQTPARDAASDGKPGRLWGGIVPQESAVWFFKLTGPVAEVSRLDSPLREFLQSVEFVDQQPKWTLPAAWTERPGNEFRFATILIPSAEQPLELTVSKLPRNESFDRQLLENVNRWRGQLTLPPVTMDELPASTERLTVAGVEAAVVSLEGILKPSTMRGRPPFAPQQ